MFVLIWATLLFPLRGGNADTGASVRLRTTCQLGFCIILSEEEITAEAGLCAEIPCYFYPDYYFETQNMVWFKCDPSKQQCGGSDMIFHTNKQSRKIQSGFKGRVSMLQPDVRQNNCSIIINDLTESDSGSYQFRAIGFKYNRPEGFTFARRANVSVKDLIQKPTVKIPPLTEGHQTTLTCTAPGLCSGAKPEITWMWRRVGESDFSHIAGNITAFNTENLTAVTQRHSSSLTFNPSAEHHDTEVTCKVSFANNITAEETVTLNVTWPVQHCGPDSAVLPWAVAAVSLFVNAILIICVWFLWKTRQKVKPDQEDRTYMSLQKTGTSAEYDVIGQPLN